jgi:uncharacterized protein (TIGR00730 family)
MTNGTLPSAISTGPAAHSIRSVCVYCGSGTGLDPAYAEGARTLGRDLNGVRLIYGGGSLGLMGEVARATLAAGGQVTGIIPGFLSNKERMLREVDELVVTDNMHERKMLMFERSDAFVALPGGIGTLEELVEQLTWSQLGRHAKPIVVANINGFWSPFLSLLSHMKAETFIRSALEIKFVGVDRRRQWRPGRGRSEPDRALLSGRRAAHANGGQYGRPHFGCIDPSSPPHANGGMTRPRESRR